MKKKWFRLIILCLLAWGALQLRQWIIFHKVSSLKQTQEPLSSGLSRPPQEKSLVITQRESHPHAASPQDLQSKQEQLFSQFQEKFGSHLKAYFSDQQKLLRIEGEIGRGERAFSSFQPTHEEQVKKRAQDILSSLKDLIGTHVASPLELSQVRLGPVSAQVYFKQKFGKDWIEPEGHLKIDLGPHGELIALYSGYVSKFEMKNQRTISHEVAQKKIRAFLKEIHRELNPEEPLVSTPLVWVQGEVGYYAEQFRVKGLLIVMDAQSGEILYSKDIRQT